jgi:hypothetical protein
MELVVVTVLMPTTTVSYIGGSSYLCDFCNVTLIKKMDDPDNKRYICPGCGNIKDPLNVEDKFNSIKHQERGQTIRSSSSGGNNNEDAILRGQGYKILRKEITSADGQRKMS